MTFELPPDSPLFIFPFPKPLENSERENVLTKCDLFLSQWKTHEKPIAAKAWLEENQFLLIAVDPSLNSPSGCSKDKLFHFVSILKNQQENHEFPLHLFWVKSDSELMTFTKKELLENLEKGMLSIENQLFPTWITQLEQYQKEWGKPIENFSSLLRLHKPISNI
jgi:hypothetical protein